MSCEVLVDKSGTGTGDFTTVGSVDSLTGTLVLDSYDPSGCYNIQCVTNDTIKSRRIEFTGPFTNDNTSTGKWTALNEPFFLSGAASGKGCTKLAPSCEALDITVESTRAAPTGADLAKHTCATVKIACEEEVEPPTCYTCPSGTVPLIDCPANDNDCKPECEEKDDSSDDGKSGYFKKSSWGKYGEKSKSKSCGDDSSDDSKVGYKDGKFGGKDGYFKKDGDYGKGSDGDKDGKSESKYGDYGKGKGGYGSKFGK
jgi:hypothetical protein